MIRLASPRPGGPRRTTRADLLAKSALYGALTGAFGLIATSPVQAGSGALQTPGLPVQAPTTPQVAGGNANQPLISVTGHTMTVGTDANRTLIDWNSFTVAQGNAVNFTFNNRSDIVLNRLVNSTPVVINGGLTGTVQGNIGGNVWFSAPGGVVFGSTAVVNVGGMLATTALVDVNSFLNPNNTSSFPFAYPGTGYPGTTGYPGGTYFPGTVTYPGGSAYPGITGYPVSNVAGGVGGVTVQAGATLTAQGGLMALIAPFVNVAPGAIVRSTDQTQVGGGGGGAGSVLYGSANAFTVSLSQETSGDLDMLQFVINQPSEVTDNPLLLQGTTTGTNVYVASLTASGITGAVIDATGTLNATTAAAGQGGEIILSTGADTVTAPSGVTGAFTPGSASNQQGTAYSPSDLRLGSLTAGEDIQASSSGALNGATGTGYAVMAGSDATLLAQGDLTLNDVTSSLGVVTLNANSITAGALNSGSFTQVTTLNDGASGAISLGSVTSGAGIFITAFDGPVTLASTLTANGGSVNINAGGNVTLGDSVFAAGDVNISAVDDSGNVLGGISTTDITADGVISLQGASVVSTSLTAYGFTEGPSIYVSATTPAESEAASGFIDIGSAAANGDISLTANGGYASLGSVDFFSSGQTLNITANAFAPVYLGYTPGGPAANGGSGPTGGVGSITGTGTIDLFSLGDVNVNVSGDAVISSAQGANIYVTATGLAELDNATTNGGPSDPIDVMGASAVLGTASSADAINVTATNGSATAGDLTAAGAITITATNGVASLHSATLASGTNYPPASDFPQPVSLTATGTGADVLIGDPVGVLATGFITNATSVTAQADEDVTVNVAQGLSLTTVSAGRSVNLTAPALTVGSLQGTLAGDITVDVTDSYFGYAQAITAGGAVTLTAGNALLIGDVTAKGGDVTLTTPSFLNVDNVTSQTGSVTLSGAMGVSVQGTGQAAENFVATSLASGYAPGAGTVANPSQGSGTVRIGDVTATSGYIDLEGTNVTSGNLTAGAANPANGFYTYAAAWGPDGSGGSLNVTPLSPTYDTGQVFLYPAPAPQPPPPVDLPQQDPNSPFQFDSGGTAPTIGAPGLIGDGNTGETVTLNARRTLIDWTSYTIGSGGEVDYVFNPVEGQGVANARGNIVLNRITGGGPVDIEGVLTSTVAGDTQAYGGNVWFSAPGGIVFGTGAVVNVGGLLATTAGFSPANLTRQFLDPTVFTFNLDGAGSGYPSGATGFPFGSGYPGGTGYPTGEGVGVTVESGAQISGSGSLVALIAPFVQVQAGAQVSDLDANGNGAASVLYAAAPSSVLTVTQPALGGDVTNGPGDLDFASLAIGTGDLSGYDTPLDLEGTTTALNIYAAALSPSQVSSAVANATGALTAVTSATGAGGEIILSTGADTITAGQAPTLSTASIGAVDLSVGTITAAADLQVLSSGAIQGAGNSANLLSSGGNLALVANAAVSLASATSSGGDISVLSTGTATNPFTGQSYVTGLGTITATSLNAAGALTLGSLSVTATSLTAGGAATIDTYANPDIPSHISNIDLGTLTGGGAITVDAGDGYASITNLVLNGAATLNLTASGAVYLGYAPGGTGSGAASGSITNPNVGSIRLTGGGDVDVDIPGALTLTEADATSTMVNVTAGSLTVNSADAAYGINLTASTGDLKVGVATVVFGTVGLNATSTLGSASVGTAYAPNITVTAAQQAELDGGETNRFSSDDTVRTVSVTGASVVVGGVDSQNDVVAQASNGSATVGEVTAGGNLTVSAVNGSASLHSAGPSQYSPSGALGAVSVTATGSGADVTLGGADGSGFVTGAASINLQADQDVNVNVDLPIELNLVQAGRYAILTAPALTLDSLQGGLGGGIDIDVTNAGFTYANALNSEGNVTVTASGALTLGDVTAAGGPVMLQGAGISAGRLDAFSDLTLTSTGGDIVLTGSATAGQDIVASATSSDQGGVSGLGAITATTMSAGGAIDLLGSSVFATSVSTSGKDGETGQSITAAAYDPGDGINGAAFVDIGSVSAPGNITLTANDGYASLTSATFTASGQTLSLTSQGGSPVYLGYGQGGPSANGGGGPTAAQGGVSGVGSVNLASGGDVNVNVTSDATLANVTALGALNITSPSQVIVSSNLEIGGDITVTTPGSITLQTVASDAGSVTLSGGAGINVQGEGQAAGDFIATAITGYAPGAGTVANPSHGSGAITIGDVATTSGYIDLEGTDVTSGALTAGGANPANGYYTYSAAWGADGSGGALSYGALSPTYDTGLVFLYPTPAAPPPTVALPVQDTSSPFQFDSAGAAPTIGAPGLIGDGNTGETVTLNARRTLIDWTSYTIGSGGEVDYVFNPVEGQGVANARGNIVLNRITGGGPVDIEGVLTSTVAGDTQAYGGNVWFSAPGGVVFGTGAVVNVGGLLATTAGFSPANLTNQFLDPTVFTFTLDGAGSGYPSGATGFPGGFGYPGGTGYPVDSDAIGVTVEGGAQISGSGSLVALIAPFVQVQAGAEVSDLDANGQGAASVLYAAAPSSVLTVTQPSLGGDAVNGQGDLDFAALAIGTGDLSGYATPLTLQGTTNALNVYAAALSPSQISGAVADATGQITATTSATGAGGEIILSTGADTVTAGEGPSLSTASIGAMQLDLDNVTAGGPLQVLSSGGIDARADPAGLLQSGGDLTLSASGDINLATATAGGNVTATALTTVLISGEEGGGFALFGVGAVSANSVTAGGSIDLEGSSVTANTLAAGSGGGLGGVTASAYETEYGQSPGTASVDIGSASATGDISLTANDGYASLTSVTLNGTGQTLTLNAYGFEPYVGYDPAYLGYSAGGPNVNSGAGPTGGVGAVSGSGAASAAINLFAYGNVDVDLPGAVRLNNVTSTNNTVNLVADTLTITGEVQGYYGINATARTGDLNANAFDTYYEDVNVTATQGSVFLTSAAINEYGDVNVSAPNGSVFLANAVASNIYVTAGQTAHVDNATTFALSGDPIDVTGATAYLGTGNSQDDINVTATNGSATAGDLTALGTITVTATNGSASLHSASLSSGTGYPGAASFPNTVSVTATGTGADVLIGDPMGVFATGFVTGATSITATADRDVTVNVAQPLELNLVSAGRNASLTAPSLTLDSLQGALTGDLAIDVTADGFTYAAPITVGGEVAITAAGPLALGDVTAPNGTIGLAGAGVSAGDLNASYLGVTADGGDIALGDATSASNLILLATGSIAAANLAAGPTAYIEAFAGLEPTAGAAYDASASLTLASATGGGNMYLNAPGAVRIGTLTTTPGATGAINVTDFSVGAIDNSGGYASPDPTTIVVGSATAGGDLHLVAQQSVTATSLSAAGETLVYTQPVTGAVYATPAFVDVGSAVSTGGGTISLQAASGYASLTSAAFTQPGGALSITTFADGAPVYLGYAQGGQQAGGGSGAVTGAPTVELTSGGAIAADVAGPLALDQVNAAGAVNITADTLAINAVYDNATDFGAMADGTINLSARTGGLSVATLESFYGPVSLAASGDITAGVVVGEGIKIAAGGVADVTYASTIAATFNDDGSLDQSDFTTAPVQITGTSVTLGQGFSYGAFTLVASNGSATAGDLEFGGGAISISAVNGAASLHSASLEGTGLNYTPLLDGEAPQPSPSAISLTASGTGADVLIGGMTTTGRFPGLGFVSGAASLSAQADRDVTVDVGGAVALTSVQAGRNTSVTADQLTLGTLTAGQDATLTTPNPAASNPVIGPFTGTPTLTADTVSAGEDLTITAGGALTVDAIAAGRNLSITAPSVSLAALTDQPSGAILIDATASGFTDTGALSAAGGVTATAAGALSLADVTSSQGTVTLTGASVTAAKLSSGADTDVTANAGDISLASVTAGGDVNVSASGQISLGDGSAAGDLSLVTGSGDIDATGLLSAGSSVRVSSGGSTHIQDVTAQTGSVTLMSGLDISFAAASAGSDVFGQSDGALTGALIASGGAIILQSQDSLDIGSVTAATRVDLTSASGYASLTSAAFTQPGGALSITTLAGGAPIYLGYAQGGQQAGGASGSITGAPTIELNSGGGIAADVAGSLTLDQANAAGPVSIAADSVSANLIDSFADVPGGNAGDGTITVLARTGDVTSGGIEAYYGPLTISAPSGNVTIGDQGASGQGVTITAAGLANIAYASTVAYTTNEVGFDAFYTNAPITITASQVILGSSDFPIAGNSYGGYQITATNGDATVGNIYFGGGPVSVSATNGTASLHAAAPLGYAYDYPPFSEGYPAPGASAISVTATGANGDVVIGGGDGQGYIVGAASLTALASRDLTVTVAGALSLDTAQAGRNASVTADQLTLGTLTAGQDATLTTPNPATAQLTVAPTLTANTVSAGEDLTITAGGALTLGAISAGRNLSITAPSVSLAALTDQPSGAILIDATAGGFTDTGALSAAGGVTAIASGPLSLADVTSSQGAVTLTAASVTAGQVAAATDVQATAQSGDLQLGAVTAGTYVNLLATDGFITSPSLTAAGPINVTTTLSDPASPAPDGSYVDIGSATSRTAINLTADDGYASLTSASFLAPGGALSLTTLDGGDIYLGYAPGGTGQGGGSGSITGAPTVELAADGALNADLAGAATFDQVSAGGAISLTADALTSNLVISFGGPDGTGLDGSINLTSRAGDLSIADVESQGGPINMTSAGAATIGFMGSPGGVTLTAAGAADVGYASEIFYVADSDTGATLRVGYDLTPIRITGAQVSLGLANSYGGDVITATDGDANVGDLHFGGGAVVVQATNGTASLHSASLLGSASDVAPMGAGPAPRVYPLETPTASSVTVSANGTNANVLVGGPAQTDYVQNGAEDSHRIGGTGLGFITDASSVTLQAAQDVTVDLAQPVELNSVQAGRNVSLTAPGLTVDSLTGQLSGQVDIATTGGGFTYSSALTAGGGVNVNAAGPVLLGVVTAGGGDVDITSQGAASVGDATASGNIAIAANGGSATLHSATLTGTAGALTVTASGAASDVSLGQGTGFVQGAMQANLKAGGDITVAVTGPLTLTSAQAGGALSIAGGVLQAASLTSGGDTTLTGAGVSVGVAQIGGDLDVSSSAGATLGSITVGGALGLDAAGLASLGSVSVAGAGRITAGDLDIATLLSAPTLTLEAANGDLTVGGTTAPTDGSMWISEAEFGRIRAPTSLDLYAGSTTGTARGALVVSDLSLDPTVTPKVSLYAAPGQTVSVTGAVAPTASGGTIGIGSTTEAAWTPSTILVSGSLGAATRVTDASFTGVRAFSQVTLSSGGDVLIGSQRFFALVQATPARSIDIGLNQPGGVTATGSEIGKVYVTTGLLTIDATGKVVQQNSSGSAGSYSGLYLLNGVSTSRTALSVDPPSVVDLFGSFVNASDVLTSGAEASRSTGLQLLGLPGSERAPSNYRFNGCEISATAACGIADGQEAAFELLAQEFAGVAAATTDPQLLTQSVLLTIAPTLQIEEQLDPLVTGVGNEEIWRKRRPTGSEASDR